MTTVFSGIVSRTFVHRHGICSSQSCRFLSGVIRPNAFSLTSRHALLKPYPKLTVQNATLCTKHSVKVKLRHAIRILDKFDAVIIGSNTTVKQYVAFCVLKMRRSAVFYKNLLFNHPNYGQFFTRLRDLFWSFKARPLSAMLGASIFSWDSEKITQKEMQKFAHEITEMYTDANGQVHGELAKDWEVVINKKDLLAWRKPVPNTELYEYKMFGTFNDLPARAFFNAQADVDYRREWDSLIIKLDIIERDPSTGSEVVQWIMKFPYPMYSREYVFVRRRLVDRDQRLMVLMSRSTEHPQCPLQDQYVRVNTYMSRMVIRPHKSFDDNGFDFVLTYYDDPKANFPRVAYNWMASSGVPDYVLKMHKAAKTMYEWQQKGKWSSMDDREEQQQTQNDRMPM